MIISYKINDNYEINSPFIPINPNTVNLITGTENKSFSIIAGIIAKLFPIDTEDEMPQLESILEIYTGELEIINGKLPDKVAYVGVDPDRHFLFSTVREELISQNLPFKKSSTVLNIMGLDNSFINRTIESLSGGEKMKVALSIAFSSKEDCYILHGVLPWLDKNGRDRLKREIVKLKKEGSCIIFFDHETHTLNNGLDSVYCFDGETIGVSNLIYDFSFSDSNSDLNLSAKTVSKKITNKIPKPSILSFENVELEKHPLSNFKPLRQLLDNVSFNLNKNEIYYLIGDNGSGKSTLAQIAFRVFNPDEGIVSFCGKPISNYKRSELIQRICYVGQFPENQIVFNIVGEYIKECIQCNNDLSLNLFESYLKLPDSTSITSLSFFQMKILNLLSYISINSKLIILDEPTWGLDLESQNQLFQILIELSSSIDFTLLIITHDFSLLKSLNPRILLLKDGIMKTYNGPNEFLSDTTVTSCFDIPDFQGDTC